MIKVRNIFLTIVLLLVTAAGYSISHTEMKDSAISYYTASEYEKALEIYLSIIEENYESAALYYNIANCYFKLNDIPNAILWYERAKLLKPSDRDILQNLEIANNYIKDFVEPRQKIFYLIWYERVLNLFNTNQWALVSLMLFILLLFFVGVFLFSRSVAIKKSSFVLGIISLVLSILSLSFSLQQKHNKYNNNHAIIFSYSLVKSSPSEESTNLFEINKGLKVEIIETFNDRANIRLEDGKQGWIKKKNYEEISAIYR